jgi:predicted dehydrogenase
VNNPFLPALVAGTGFGGRVHVPALRAAGFEVAGLVGTDVERTQKRARAAGVPQSFTDLEAAIARTGAKVVSVASPPHTHAALTMIAIAHGCHVLCEKPFAADVAEARKLHDAARRAGIVHLLGHEFRWSPENATLARAVAEGLIGPLRFITMVQYLPLVANPETKMPDWWFDQNAGGGWLGAHGSHMIDQVRAGFGEFASVSAALPIVSARANVAEDSYIVRFQLTNGAQGAMLQTAGAWGPAAGMFRVSGTKGTLWIEGGAVKIADRNGTRDLPIPEDLALPALASGEDPRQNLSLALFTRLCEAFRARIEGRAGSSAAVPLPTFADGVAGMAVLDAIRASAAKDGAPVTLTQG